VHTLLLDHTDSFSTAQESVIIIIIIHEFHRDASLEQNFRAAVRKEFRIKRYWTKKRFRTKRYAEKNATG